MPQQQQKCFYCNKPSTLLCDFILGKPFGGYGIGGHPVAKIAPMHTCDMPLCRDHAEYRGWIHIKASKGGGFDSYDYCLEHRGVQDHGAPVIGDSEAERLRRVVWALAQRRAMRERGVVRGLPPPPEQGTLF